MNQDQNNLNTQDNNNNNTLNNQPFENNELNTNFNQNINQTFNANIATQIVSNAAATVPIKLIVGIIAGITVVTAGIAGGIYFNNKTSNNNSQYESAGSNNKQNTSLKEISTDYIGEYEFKKAEYIPTNATPTKVTFYQGEILATLDFSQSELKPYYYGYDGVDFASYASMSLSGAHDYENDTDYQKVDANKYSDVIDITGLSMYYYEGDPYKSLVVGKNGIFWGLSVGYKNTEETEAAFKQMLKIVNFEYDESSMKADEYNISNIKNMNFTVINFDFNKDIFSPKYAYVYFINNDNIYQIKDIDAFNIEYNKQRIYINLSTHIVLGNRLIDYVDEVKKQTSKVYESEINGKKIRIYTNSKSDVFYVGFIVDNAEYLLNLYGTNLSAKDVASFLKESIK